jgi:hypothetical protein
MLACVARVLCRTRGLTAVDCLYVFTNHHHHHPPRRFSAFAELNLRLELKKFPPLHMQF